MGLWGGRVERWGEEVGRQDIQNIITGRRVKDARRSRFDRKDRVVGTEEGALCVQVTDVDERLL